MTRASRYITVLICTTFCASIAGCCDPGLEITIPDFDKEQPDFTDEAPPKYDSPEIPRTPGDGERPDDGESFEDPDREGDGSGDPTNAPREDEQPEASDPVPDDSPRDNTPSDGRTGGLPGDTGGSGTGTGGRGSETPTTQSPDPTTDPSEDTPETRTPTTQQTLAACVPHRPQASAYAPATVDTHASVILDASTSSSPRGDTLRYFWRQLEGEIVTFEHSTERVTFDAPSADTTLVFELVVADALLISTPAYVTVEVRRQVSAGEGAGPVGMHPPERGDALDAIITHGHIYTMSDAGIEIYTSPEATPVGVVPLQDRPQALAGVEDTLYAATVAGGRSTIEVFGLDHADNPTPIGRASVEGELFEIEAVGDALIGLAPNAVVTLDISDATPTARHRRPLEGAVDLAVDGRTVAVLTRSTNGMRVASFTLTPSSLSVLGSVAVSPHATSIALHEGVVFVGEAGSVSAITLDDGATLDTFETLGRVNALEHAEGDAVLMVTDDDARLHALDVQDPSAMAMLGTWRLEPPADGALRTNIALAPQLAVVARQGGAMTVVPVPQYTHPGLSPIAAERGEVRAVHVQDGRVYTADVGAGMRVYDIDTDDALTHRSSLSAETMNVASITVNPDTGVAYLGEEGEGVHIVSIGDDLQLAHASTWTLAAAPRQLMGSQGQLFVLDATHGLVFADLADPMAPRGLDRFDSVATSNAFDVEAGFFAFGMGDALWSVEESAFDDLATTTIADTPVVAIDADGDSDRVAVALGDGGVALMRRGDDGLELLGRWRSGGHINAVAIHDAWIYATERAEHSHDANRLVVLAQGEGPDLEVRATLELPGAPFALSTSDEHVVVADGHRGALLVKLPTSTTVQYRDDLSGQTTRTYEINAIPEGLTPSCQVTNGDCRITRLDNRDKTAQIVWNLTENPRSDTITFTLNEHRMRYTVGDDTVQ